MRVTISVGNPSSKSHRNVDAIHVSVSVTANGAKEHQNAAPADVATSALPVVLMEAAGSQPGATISDAATQSHQDAGMNGPVTVASIDGMDDTVEEVD